MTRRRNRCGGDRGQAAIELALAMPVVLVLAVAAAQLGALGVRQLAIGIARAVSAEFVPGSKRAGST